MKSFGIGKYCVIRTYSAGVHVGILQERNGREVVLSQSRRLWRWEEAFTLSEVALNGVGEESKLSAPIETIMLAEVIEILPTTTLAEANLRGISNYEI